MPITCNFPLLTVAVVSGLPVVVQAVVDPLVQHWPLVLRALCCAVLVLALG